MQAQTRNLVIVALVAMLVVATCWKQSPGQGEAAKPGAAMEYLVVPANTETLNTFAEKQPWEVVAAFSQGKEGASTGLAILRRPKAAK
jgi:hypothetical protein